MGRLTDHPPCNLVGSPWAPYGLPHGSFPLCQNSKIICYISLGSPRALMGRLADHPPSLELGCRMINGSRIGSFGHNMSKICGCTTKTTTTVKTTTKQNSNHIYVGSPWALMGRFTDHSPPPRNSQWGVGGVVVLGELGFVQTTTTTNKNNNKTQKRC